MQPEQIDTHDWYKHTRMWRQDTFCDATASIEPEVVTANEAHPWEITVKLGKMGLEPGDHVAVEVHTSEYKIRREQLKQKLLLMD